MLITTDDMEKAISKIFGIGRFSVGIHNEKTVVDYLWCVVLTSKFRERVAIVAMEKNDSENNYSLEGALLIPKLDSPSKEKTEYIENIKTIKLPKPNPVEEAMKSMPILPLGSLICFGAPMPTFNIHTETQIGAVDYLYIGMNETKSHEILWGAILETFDFLLKEHDNEEMRLFCEKYRQ